MNLNGDSKDIKSCLMFAMRYAIGRRTFAPDITTGVILSNIDLFEDWELATMIDEVSYNIQLDNAGDDCDIIVWRDFLNRLKEYKK